MEKTLGGDRLGAGKKQKVELHNYERSTHDLGYLWRSTMSAGTLVPFLVQVALPGDTWDIDLNTVVLTHPTTGPLYGSYKVQLDTFIAPIRLYQGALHNNKLGVGLKMDTIKLPIFKLKASPLVDNSGNLIVTDIDNSQINPSSIFAYLGVRGVGSPSLVDGVDTTRSFNALSWLMYWDTVKNYYSNKQEEIGYVVHTPPAIISHNVDNVYFGVVGSMTLVENYPLTNPIVTFNGAVLRVEFTGTQDLRQVYINTSSGFISAADLGTIINSGVGFYEIQYDWNRYGTRTILNWYYPDSRALPIGPITTQSFPLSDIDAMREKILSLANNPAPFVINDSASPGNALQPWNYALEEGDTWNSRMQSQEGLALKTYQSDLFNNWLQTEWIDGPGGITEITSVDTSSGSFSIDTLILSKKVYEMLNRIAVSGGSYDDYLDAVYTNERHTRAETPMYMGGLIKELVFQEVISNSESGAQNEGVQPLGTLAGRGVLASKHKGGHITIKVDEPSYIMGIVSITPRIDYSQGNSWDTHLTTIADLYKPALGQIGFQELITEQMAWWSTYQDDTGEWITKSAGKQPAWINYMTNINKVYGNFAIQDNEGFMILNRKYQPAAEGDSEISIDDLTTYIDPAKYNSVFAQTALDAQNFWVQISVDIQARRKMTAKVIPNL